MNDTAAIDLEEIDRIVESIGRRPEHVTSLLQAIQSRHNYLPAEALRRLGDTTDITPAQIVGVASFYSGFRLRPAGRHFIRVCVGTACHVKGAQSVYDAFRRHLDMDKDSDTDRDRLFTVEQVACLGCCMLAPAVQIDDVIYGHVEPRGVAGVLRDFLRSRGAAAGAVETNDAKPLKAAAGEVRLCLCSSCTAGGARTVYEAFREEARVLGLPAEVKVVGCTGISYQAPLVEIVAADGQAFHYGRVKAEDAGRVLRRHFTPGRLSRRLKAAAADLLERLLTDEAAQTVTRYAIDVRAGPDASFSGRQLHLVTEGCGAMGPLDLDAYVKSGGFEALDRCLRQMTPDDVVRQIAESGLRGRGGGGFLTGLKWAAVREAREATRVLVCNGDEGDPGAFMDRMILESFPLRVIEGMLIAAYAVGASRGFLYIREEYALARRRMAEAVALCERHGLVGERVMGREFGLRLTVVSGAGAFVCGEETALMAAIEGRRGMPRFRPPYPSESGLWGHPTLINNVETLALAPWILRHGPAAFAAIGTSGSKGTKTFALAGKIVRGGLIEAPMGMTLREIVEDIGGGVADGKCFKAVQIGGPSGACIPASLADIPVDYQDLKALGAIMGSGGLVVLDESDCMVDVSRYFMAFTQRESCGKCTYCRIGSKRMLEVLERLCGGKGKAGDIEELEHLGKVMAEGSLCGLGRTAPNPVLSTLKYFRAEYEAHVRGQCPAMRCKSLIAYEISDDCIGCTRCAQHCPADAIEMAPYAMHRIQQDKCVRCDTCRQVCPAHAVRVVAREKL